MDDAADTPQRRSTATAILDAAIDHIERFGVDGMRIERVLADASSSTGSMRHHFGSRAGLVEAAQHEIYVRTMLAESTAHLDAGLAATTTEEFLDYMSEQLTRIASDPVARERRMTRLRVFANASTRPELMEAVAWLQQQLIEVTAGVFRSAQSRGLINTSIDAYDYAAWFHGLTLSRTFTEATMPEADRWLAVAIPAAHALLRPEQ
jgi:AcrR family transcriptional regulator